MKNFLVLLLAAAIVGFAVFAIMYWGFHFNYGDATGAGLAAAAGGIVAEYTKTYFQRRKAKQSR